MAKLWNQIIENLTLKNAPSTGARSSSGSGAVNRDPKAMQVKRVGYQFVEGGGGRDSFEGPRTSFEVIDSSIERDSYVMQTMMKYSELIFKSGWYLSGKNPQTMEYLKLRLDTMGVATNIPTETLFQGIADDLVRYANCFIIKARSKGGIGLPPGLSVVPIPPAKEAVAGYFRVPPHSMTISRDINGTVLKYRQEIAGADKPIDFNPHDVIHISINRPVGRPFGLPWITPVLEDIRLLRKIEENAALLLHRHIFPLLAYTVGIDKPGYEATDEEILELQGVIESMPTDGAIVLPERHKITPIKVDGVDGHPYLEYFEKRAFTGLGMSAVDMGRGDTANKNTADAMGGIKADRVKGWQRVIETEINRNIIDELLVEGGFDPLANVDFNVDFVFEETEQERKIAKENHAILKWNSNLATFEETRQTLGFDPVADESRLIGNMFMKAKEEGTGEEVDNKNAPENQSGKKSAPKKKTESILESTEEPKKFKVQKELSDLFASLENATLDSIISHVEKKAFPESDPKEWSSLLRFSKDKMKISLVKQAILQTSDGARQAKEDLGRERAAQISVASIARTTGWYVEDSLDNMGTRIKENLIKRLAESKTKEEAVLAVRGAFASNRFRIESISKSTMMKSYNFGYALAMMKYGESTVQPFYEGTCPTCQEKAREEISLNQFSSLDEIAIFYRIPPWHPNCDCKLEHVEGGEK